MSSEFSNNLTEAQIERLAILSEELGEAQQCIGKILRHGYESHNPVIVTGRTNREELERELGDVTFIINFLVRCRDVSGVQMEVRTLNKQQNIKKWLHHQEVL